MTTPIASRNQSVSHPRVILGWPAFVNKATNPYQALLYESMQCQGAVVLECKPREILLGSYDILHLHWPEHQFAGRTFFSAVVRAARFFIIISIARLKRARVVWTAHNLRPHADQRPKWDRFCRHLLLRRLSGVISLNEAVKDALKKDELKGLNIPVAVIPHGNYRNFYPQSVDRHQARSDLGIDAKTSVVVGWVGLIKAYKGLPELLVAWNELTQKDASLLIAGDVSDPALGPLLTTSAERDPRISFFPGWIGNDRMQYFLKASDVIILPFRAITNSGSAVLALSFNVPVVLPRSGATEELQANVGREWVYLYDGIISASILDEMIAWAAKPRAVIAPLGVWDWDRLAADTLAFFDQILRGQALPDAKAPTA